MGRRGKPEPYFLGLKALPEQAKSPPDRREAAVGGVPNRHPGGPLFRLGLPEKVA